MHRLSRSFGAVADAYDRGRPTYPAEAVTWLMAGEAKIVLELGAGTGKLTREIVDQGHAVFATEPDEAMLEVLKHRVPEVSAKVAGAEEIPANDHSVDVVVAAQAFHWFDHDRALPEIARVLRAGGHVALAWNFFDQRIPWVRRLVEAMGGAYERVDSSEILGASELFERGRARDVHALARRQPRHPRRHRRVALLHRLPARGRARGQARRGPGAVRRLRPRPRRHAAALRHRVLPREGPRPTARSRQPTRGRRITTRDQRERRHRHGHAAHRLPLTVRGLDATRVCPMWRWRRTHLGGEADRAAFRALHNASLAGPALREGLTGDQCRAERATPARAARHPGRRPRRHQRAARLGRPRQPPPQPAPATVKEVAEAGRTLIVDERDLVCDGGLRGAAGDRQPAGGRGHAGRRPRRRHSAHDRRG